MSQSYALDGVRADLTADAEILALMAQDLSELSRQNVGPTPSQLFARGWASWQIDRYFLRAATQAFRTHVETRATPQQARQAKPFLKFDAWMRELLDRAGYVLPAANEVA